MLALFRGFLSTWAARAFFLLLVGSFVLWGVSGAVRNGGGSDTAVAVVGRETVEPQQMLDAFRNAMNVATQRNGGQPLTPENKQQVAQITLEALVQNALVADQARRLGVAAPDSAIRASIFAVPIFRGPSGQFDRNAFNTWLLRNNMTEPRVVEFIRAGLLHDQLLDPARSGMAVPEALAARVFQAQGETRTADLVELPFAAAPAPPEPGEDDLRRIYDNNPGAYSAPAYRRIRAVVLSPETIARTIDVGDAEIGQAYQANLSRFVEPEKRAAEIVVAPDEAAAQRLAAEWRGGAEWAAIERDANGATTLKLPDGVPSDYPTDELRNAVFAAVPGTVTGPLASPGGWLLLRVTNVTPARSRSLAEAHDELREQIARPKALAELPGRRRTLEDELSAVDTLDKLQLPAGLGVAPITGTLDEHGNTAEGEPAPIPGSPAVRQAILTAAFQAAPGTLPVLTQAPDQTWFALTLEEASAPELKPFDQVQAQLRADYELAARRRVQEEAAARLLAAAKTAHSLDDAATVADLRVVRTPPLRRGAAAPDVPLEVVNEVFGAPKGEPTMVQAGEAFYVALPVDVSLPDPASDPAAVARIKAELSRSMQDDVELTYVNALRTRTQPRVNRDLLDKVTQ